MKEPTVTDSPLFLSLLFIENNAYSFGRTTIANLDTEWVSKCCFKIFTVNAVINCPFHLSPAVMLCCGCTLRLHFSICYWRCTAWDGTPPRCTTKRTIWWEVSEFTNCSLHTDVNFVDFCLYFHLGETHFIYQWNLKVRRRVWDKATLWVRTFFFELLLFCCLSIMNSCLSTLLCSELCSDFIPTFNSCAFSCQKELDFPVWDVR